MTSDANEAADEAARLGEHYEVARTVQGNYHRVALQFPDAMLPDAPAVCRLLSTGAKMARDGDDPDAPASPFFFIIGDTSYGACCADEVAAQHLNADAIVHYGPTCLSPTARLPVIHVFGRRVLRPDPQAVAASIAGALRRQNEEVGGADPVARALLFYDLGYAHAVPELGRLLGALLADDGVEVVVASLPSGALEGKEEEDGSGSSSSSSAPQQQQQQEQGRGTVVAGGLQVSLPDDGGEEKRTRTAVAYIGPAEGKQLATIMLRFNSLGDCLVYDPNPTDSEGGGEGTAGVAVEARWAALATQRELKRRYYMVQRARDASIFGIVVGTLGVSRYLRVVASVRSLIERAGKKAYTLVVGKLNPAKLANFAEIEAFVLVACPESSLLPDGGRDFHAPIITPLELEMALGGRAWDGFYSTDFRDLESLFARAASVDDDEQKDGEEGEEEEEEEDRPYFSLVSGGFRAPAVTAATRRSSSSSREAITTAASASSSSVGGGQLLAYHSPAGEFLQLREYRGLGHDKPLGREEEEEEDGAESKPPEGIVEGRRGMAADYGGF